MGKDDPGVIGDPHKDFLHALEVYKERNPMLNISKSEYVQIQIKSNGKVVWINTAEGMCVARISQIKHLEIVDDRGNKR